MVGAVTKYVQLFCFLLECPQWPQATQHSAAEAKLLADALFLFTSRREVNRRLTHLVEIRSYLVVCLNEVTGEHIQRIQYGQRAFRCWATVGHSLAVRTGCWVYYPGENLA